MKKIIILLEHTSSLSHKMDNKLHIINVYSFIVGKKKDLGHLKNFEKDEGI